MKKHSFNILIATANRLTINYFYRWLHSFLVPIDYTRTKEIPALLDASGILERTAEKLKILDIGSPQILSLALGQSSNVWDVTYVNSFEPELEDLRQKAATLGLNTLNIVNGDISDIKSVSGLGTYDYIFSCSVFEHIHPEDGGDVTASKNIPQLLKPGGAFVFSVPFYKMKFNEYKDGDVYAVKGEPSSKTFFQRFYDEESLQAQIVAPTGLRIAEKTYIGERYYSEHDIRKRMAFLIGFGRVSYLLGRFFNRISDVFMEETHDFRKLNKPYLAICSLVKD
jgi:2-polyprenyl-3-methyl-5-hydroxy-6-metoxy-1,4-benzoquinol methylase